jgi:hypothetical protein
LSEYKNIYQKLLHIQQSVETLVKDQKMEQGQKYKYVSSNLVVDTIRPLMNDLRLILTPRIIGSALSNEKVANGGTTRYMTELTMEMEWRDCDTGEVYVVPFYAQGTDLAGEKGVGKALTYGEKYYFLKQFHIGTPNDDPDADQRTKSGEKTQRGTQAEKENNLYFRRAIRQMAEEMAAGDESRLAAIYLFATKDESHQYAGVEFLDKISDAALKIVYPRMKGTYKKKTGKEFDESALKDPDSREAAANEQV